MLTFIDLYKQDSDADLNTVQKLVGLGYARDYGAQKGRRTEVRLRIWGITDSGKAVLEQQTFAESSSKLNAGQAQLGMELPPKNVLTIKTWVRPITTNQLAEVGRARKKEVVNDKKEVLKEEPDKVEEGSKEQAADTSNKVEKKRGGGLGLRLFSDPPKRGTMQ